MSNLFRGRADNPPQRLERELQTLEQQARSASPGYETQFLNRAGHLCVEAGQAGRALGYYGRAIDAYMESGRFSAAEVLCKKVLKIAPHAVRARCTLAWLAIGKGYRSGTDVEIRDYVEAAQRAGQDALAAKQLRMMGEATTSPDLRERLAEYLLDLGDEEEAERLFGRVFAERNGLRPAPFADEGKLWARLLKAALMSPQELKQQGATPGDDEGDHGSADLPSLRQEQEKDGR